MRVSQQTLRGVLATLTFTRLTPNEAAPVLVPQYRTQPDDYLIRLRYRTQRLLSDEKHVTCFEFVPFVRQATTAKQYRQALLDIIADCNYVLQRRQALRALLLAGEYVEPNDEVQALIAAQYEDTVLPVFVRQSA